LQLYLSLISLKRKALLNEISFLFKCGVSTVNTDNKSMKRSILLLIAITLVASISAFDFTVNGIFYKIKTPASSNRVAVTAGSSTGNSYAGAVVIPSTVTYNAKTYSVTEFDSWAFVSCYDLTAITIPNTVDTINDGAFWGCIKMTSLTLPASVKKIGNYVFVGDTTLTTITVDAANAYFKSDQGVLYNKTLNVLLSYPTGKPALSYTIPSTVDTLGAYSFAYCKLTSISIPNTVKYMYHATFCMCYGLTSVNLPASLTYLNNNPFYDCTNMTAVNVDPANQENQSVDGVLYKKGLTTIIYYPPAKSGSSFVIPSTVTYVRSSVFMNATKLNSVTIPASMTTIRSGMFSGCTGLTTINAYPPVPITLNEISPGSNAYDVFKGVDTLHCVLHVPVGSRSLYANAFQWKGFSNIVEGFTSGFTSAKTSNIKVTAQNGKILLSGYAPGELITVYNTRGIILYQRYANSPTTTINPNYNGVVVVKAGSENIKVLLF